VQEGVPFLVMDYAPNGSLRRRYPKGRVVPHKHELKGYVKSKRGMGLLWKSEMISLNIDGSHWKRACLDLLMRGR
jgi:hypothetical protein